VIATVVLPKTREKCSFTTVAAINIGISRPENSGYCRNVRNLWFGSRRLLPFHRPWNRRFWGDGRDAWFSDMRRRRGLTLQQHATPKFQINGNASREIPELMKRSGVIGNHNSLLPLIQQSGH